MCLCLGPLYLSVSKRRQTYNTVSSGHTYMRNGGGFSARSYSSSVAAVSLSPPSSLAQQGGREKQSVNTLSTTTTVYIAHYQADIELTGCWHLVGFATLFDGSARVVIMPPLVPQGRNPGHLWPVVVNNSPLELRPVFRAKVTLKYCCRNYNSAVRTSTRYTAYYFRGKR